MRTRETILKYLQEYCGEDIANDVSIESVTGNANQRITVYLNARTFALVVWADGDVPTFRFFGVGASTFDRVQRKALVKATEERLASGNFERHRESSGRPIFFDGIMPL